MNKPTRKETEDDIRLDELLPRSSWMTGRPSSCFRFCTTSRPAVSTDQLVVRTILVIVAVPRDHTPHLELASPAKQAKSESRRVAIAAT